MKKLQVGYQLVQGWLVGTYIMLVRQAEFRPQSVHIGLKRQHQQHLRRQLSRLGPRPTARRPHMFVYTIAMRFTLVDVD